MTNKPGINEEQFTVSLDKECFQNQSVLKSPCYEYTVKIISKRRYQWYWRVLYYLTFKKYFGIEYELEIIDGPKIEQNGCR